MKIVNAVSGNNKEKPQQRYLVVVDQDAGHRLYLSMLLQRFNYHVVTAGAIDEARGMIAVAVPALVIVDADLPGEGARRLLQHLRMELQTAATATIGQVTNGADPSHILQMGFDACLHKPVPPEELYRTVQKLIEPTPRANVRIHTRLPVMVNGKPLDCVEGECGTVLSEHGMYIRTLKPLAVKSNIEVAIAINGRTIPLRAEVRYSHCFGEGPFGEPGMGLQFTKIAPRDQESIRQFILADITRGIQLPA